MILRNMGAGWGQVYGGKLVAWRNFGISTTKLMVTPRTDGVEGCVEL